MAISLDEQYPGKTAGTSAAYPYGKARNVSAPSDGTGTPFEAALVNDDQGFKQSLLLAAGIVPSGTPDEVGASQYLLALLAIIDARIAAAVPRKVHAWVRFGWNGAAVVIHASSGVASVSRVGLGKYRIFFTTSTGGVAYAVTGNAQQLNFVDHRFSNVLVPMFYGDFSVDVWLGDNSEDEFYDSTNVNVAIYK